MKNSKRILTAICAVIIALSASALNASAAASSLDNFQEAESYIPGQFSDISENEWFGYNNQRVVCSAYQLGLMQGTNAGFKPGSGVTLAEAITMAARVNNIYNGGEWEFHQSSPWYYSYLEYAVYAGIVQFDEFDDYTRLATRAEMAYVFSRALPQAEFAAINTVDTLPDVNANTPYQSNIFMLYRAGVLTGGDIYGTFKPTSDITRAEAAAIITRIALTSERKAFTLTPTDPGAVESDYPIWEEVYTPGMQVDTAEELFDLIDAAGRNMIPAFEILLDNAAYDEYVNNDETALYFLDFGNNSSEYNYQTQVFSYQAEYSLFHQIQGIIFNRDIVLTRVSPDILDYDTQMKTILANTITPDMSERQIIRAVHDFMVVNYKYDLDFESGLDAEATYAFYGLLENNTGVCQAYAQLFYLFTCYTDIYCEIVYGWADGGTGDFVEHAWNVVYVDGDYYHVDVTFDDPVPDGGSSISYDYFLKTDEEMLIDHDW